MAIAEIITAIIILGLYILAKGVNRFFGYGVLFTIFLFAYVVTEQRFSTFYLILFLVSVVLTEAYIKMVGAQNPGNNFLVKVAVGTGMLVVILLASSFVGGQIVGVPDLSITSSQQVAAFFKPTFESMLGIIENSFTFSIFYLLLLFGTALPFFGEIIQLTFIVLPTLIASFILGVFHIVAYSVSASLVLWASFAFMLFILSNYYFKDSTSADVAHFGNNLIVSAKRIGLSIVN